MPREITAALETLRALRKRAEDKAQRLMEEIVELEDYAKRLGPIIEMVEKMPELGDTILAGVSGPPERRPRPVSAGGRATKEKIYAALRVKQLTICELAREIGMNDGYVSTLVKEDVEAGILGKSKRFDDRQAVYIISEEVRTAVRAEA